MTRAYPPSASGRPFRVGTRGSPLALVQTRGFIARASQTCAEAGSPRVFEEHPIRTTGDRVQDRPLAEIGGKGLFAKEIHEALAEGRIDLAVHSLKDLETVLPEGIVLACVLAREDARDALILGPRCAAPDPGDPLAALPAGAVIGSSSVRRRSQLLHARPDLTVALLRGNVQTRLARVAEGACDASLLALAGLKRLGLQDHAAVVLDPEAMVPASCQGIVGVTARAADEELRALLDAVEDAEARVVADAERAMLAALDGSCRTPIGAYARLLPTGEPSRAQLNGGELNLTGLVARADGSFLLKRSLHGARGDAARLGAELGASLRADSPADIFA
jgi:hydroxymethylbilane synthase